ncbi:MAG: tetratricopeptide repeat protein [Fibrobacterota bacterium]
MDKLYPFLREKIPGFNFILVFTFAACLVCAGIVYKSYKSARADEQKAYKEYIEKKSDPSEALRFERTHDEKTFDLDAHRRLALQYMDKKQYSQAIPHFERVIDADNVVFVEEHKELCLILADAYINARQTQEAVVFLEKMGDVFRNDPTILRRLGQTYYFSGNLTQAADHFRSALTKKNDDAESLVYLAKIYYQLDHTRKDIAELYERALKANPESVEPYYSYGIYRSDMGAYDSAAALFKKALAIAPFHTPSMGRLGIVYYYSGKMNEAKEMYELALSINATDYNTLYNLGELYLTAFGDPVNAYQYFQKVVDLRKDHFPAIKKLGVIALNNRNYNEAALWFEKAEDLRRRDKAYANESMPFDNELVDILILHATALEAIKRIPDAIRLLEEAIHENPLNKIARHKLQLLQQDG